MANKSGRVVTYNKELPSINHLALLSCGLVSDFDISYSIFRFKMLTLKSSPTSCFTLRESDFL